MLDIRQVTADPESFARRLARRGKETRLSEALKLDARRRELIGKTDALRSDKSNLEKEMRSADKKSPEFAAFRERMREDGEAIKNLEEELKSVEAELDEIMLAIPNVPDDVCPDGLSDEQNRVLRVVGEPTHFDFAPKTHDEIGTALGILDFERAVKITQTRFTVYRDQAARLERAVVNFMLDLHTQQHGYTEILPPFLVNPMSMQSTGQFPKFREEAYELERDELVLIPTAEVPVTNLHRDEIIEYSDLPIRYVAYTPCFRREAGSYGKDTRGLIRQHQFQKVELVQFVEPSKSDEALELLTGHAEKVLQLLKIPYRVVILCTGDLGFSSARTYDIEAWMPGQNCYREISSCSNFRDYQARRASIRYRAPGQKKPQLVHTLNGSGLAAGRTVVAIIENYQQADGTVVVPEVLRPYMGGLEVIGR